MNPAHQVIVVVFFAFAGKIRGEGAAHHLIALADGVASHAAARLKASLPLVGFPGFCCGQRSVNAGLPQIRGDRLNWWSVRRKFGILVVGRKSVGFFQPDRDPVLVQLEAILSDSAHFFRVLHQAVRFEVELLKWPSISLIRDFEGMAVSFSRLASSLVWAASACFIK